MHQRRWPPLHLALQLSAGLPIALLPVLCSGCFSPPLPDGLRLTCAQDSECPAPLTCRIITEGDGRCVSAADLDRPPPSVLASTVTPADVIRPGQRLVATLTTAAGLANAPTVTFGAATLSLDDKTKDDQATVFTFSIEIGDQAVDGTFSVAALLVDALGARAEAVLGEGPVRVDATPPAVVAASVSVDIEDRSGLVSAPTAASADAAVTISFSVTEPLQVDPVVDVGGVMAPLLFSAAPSYVFEIDGTDLAEGQQPINVSLTDGAGNSSTSVIDSVAVDKTPPDALDLSAVQYVREPWGTVAGAQRQRAFYLQTDAPLTVDGLVRVLDGDGIELARSDGSALTRLDLDAFDRPRVFVQVVDGAGNTSEPQQVTRVRWIANLQGKIAGSSLGNPHRLLLRSSDGLAPLPETNLGVEVNGSLVDRVDDVTASVVGGPSLRHLDGRTPNPVPAALAVDLHRGELLAFNQNGSIDAWTGARWRPVQLTDAEGDSAPSASLMLAAFDARRGVAVVAEPIGGTFAQLWEFDGRAMIRRGEAGAIAPDPPFAPDRIGFDGSLVVGVKTALDGAGGTRLTAWGYAGGEDVTLLCDLETDCPVVDVQGGLRVFDAGPLGLLVADRRFGPDRLHALVRIVDGVITSCDASCPLDGSVAEPMQDAAYDVLRSRWVAVRPFANGGNNAVVTSPDGRAPWSTICADDNTCGMSAVGARTLHADPVSGGIVLRDGNFAISLVEDADIKQVFRVDPCEFLGCLPPAARVPTARLAPAFVPSQQNILAIETTLSLLGEENRLLQLTGSVWRARNPPTFIFNARQDSVLVPLLAAPNLGGGDLAALGGTGTGERGILVGTGVQWGPFPNCSFTTQCAEMATPQVATMASLGPVHVTRLETWSMVPSVLNPGSFVWEPLCDPSTCQPPFTQIHAVTTNEDLSLLHALATDDDSGCAHFWQFDGATWSDNPQLALCEPIPQPLMFPSGGHVYALIGPNTLVDGTTGETLSLSDPEGDGPVRIQLTALTAAYDAAVDRTVVIGDGEGIDASPALDDTMVFEPGSAGRAAALFQVLFSESGATSPRIDRIDLMVHHVGTEPVVALFDGQKDAVLSLETPGSGRYRVQGDRLDRYITGTPRSLLVRVRSAGAEASAGVSIDAVEATIDYTEEQVQP